MNMEELCNAMVKEVQNLLPEKNVKRRKVTKNNGVVREGIAIPLDSPGNENSICAVIYIDEYKELAETSIKAAAAELVERFESTSANGNLPPEVDMKNITALFHDKEECLRRVQRCLVSNDRNEDIDFYAHKEFLDLMITYRIPLGDRAGFRVMQAHIDDIGVTLDELDKAAEKNMQNHMRSLSSLLHSMNPRFPQLPPEDDLMWILSNKEGLYGASAMTDTELLKEVGDRYNDDFYILPSTIHEVLTVPASACKDGSSPEEMKHILKQMIGDVNMTAICATDFLSDTLYRYNRKTGEVEIAA